MPCTAGQLTFSPMVEGATGSAVVYVELGHTGESCHVGSTVMLRIEDAAGELLKITGNPGTVVIEGDLPDDHLSAGWLWSNWCAQDDAIRFVFSTEDVVATLDSRTGPRCDTPAGGSSLSPLPS